MIRSDEIFRTLPVTDGAQLAHMFLWRLAYDRSCGRKLVVKVSEGNSPEGRRIILGLRGAGFAARLTPEVAAAFALRFDEIAGPEEQRPAMIGKVINAIRERIARARIAEPSDPIPSEHLAALMGEPVVFKEPRQ